MHELNTMNYIHTLHANVHVHTGASQIVKLIAQVINKKLRVMVQELLKAAKTCQQMRTGSRYYVQKWCELDSAKSWKKATSYYAAVKMR